MGLHPVRAARDLQKARVAELKHELDQCPKGVSQDAYLAADEALEEALIRLGELNDELLEFEDDLRTTEETRRSVATQTALLSQGRAHPSAPTQTTRLTRKRS